MKGTVTATAIRTGWVKRQIAGYSEQKGSLINACALNETDKINKFLEIAGFEAARNEIRETLHTYVIETYDTLNKYCPYSPFFDRPRRWGVCVCRPRKRQSLMNGSFAS